MLHKKPPTMDGAIMKSMFTLLFFFPLNIEPATSCCAVKRSTTEVFPRWNPR